MSEQNFKQIIRSLQIAFCIGKSENCSNTSFKVLEEREVKMVSCELIQTRGNRVLETSRGFRADAKQ